VAVLGINPQERKIALSLKRTQAEPWSQVGDKYEVGQLVRGTITQLANFGAFARIEDGIEGLIHVSEITDERITHPKQIVKEGDDLILRIIRIDPQRRRMGLSLRRALDTPDQELMAVFGEDVLAERDQIVANINAALEAEGIEPGSGRDDDEDEEGDETSPAKAETAVAEAPAPVQESAAGEVQALITESSNGDAPLSAMQAAFAAAGAGSDDSEAAAAPEPEAKAKTARATKAAETAQAAETTEIVDAAETGESAEIAETSESAETVETSEATEAVESGDATETAESAESEETPPA
jgi:predicted RNA-binding protein with RPS1 domain